MFPVLSFIITEIGARLETSIYIFREKKHIKTGHVRSPNEQLRMHTRHARNCEQSGLSHVSWVWFQKAREYSHTNNTQPNQT